MAPEHKDRFDELKARAFSSKYVVAVGYCKMYRKVGVPVHQIFLTTYVDGGDRVFHSKGSIGPMFVQFEAWLKEYGL